MRANSFLVKYHGTKMDEGAWKLSVVQKSEPVLRRTLHQDIPLIIFFFSQTNLVLIEYLFNFLPFDIMCILEFIQYI